MSAEHARTHAAAVANLSTIVDGVTDWDAPTPVAEWRARDVVGHLVEWLPGFLGGSGVELPGGPGAATDPVAAWRHHSVAVQDLLDDPASDALVLANPHVGELPVPVAIDRFYTTDVFLHAWDLARSSGQPHGLDPQWCAAVLAGMEPAEAMLRASGQFGERVAVPDDAPAPERLMAFLGRDPAWRP
ncbi:TIGR03086 family metal-binding protein [Nocardioides sp. CPCC 205120]|uniref:TIGR03086 family metal-binding protein n=1 Tax=Nocardioides sp. CPCC 205120 TaxID=3406462 RepID=UPI003B50A891